MKNLIIISSDKFRKRALSLIEEINRENKTWNILGFVNWGKGQYPVIGDVNTLIKYEKEIYIFCGEESSTMRMDIIEQLKRNSNIQFPTFISPSIKFLNSVQIGEGSILYGGSEFKDNIHIGKYSVIGLCCIFSTNVTIGDFVILHDKICVSENVMVGDCAEIGALYKK